jgi:pimeloyl-ACP methyl ester carboxylesterase
MPISSRVRSLSLHSAWDRTDAFVRGRPAQPLEAFLSQTEPVLAHDASPVLGGIDAPTLVTFGAHDVVTSTRYADPLTNGIANSELIVFDHLSHAGLS